MFTDLGRILLVTGLLLALAGILVIVAQRSGIGSWFGWFGHLPLDIRIERENFSFYFPIGSSILISIVLSIMLAIINRIIR